MTTPFLISVRIQPILRNSYSMTYILQPLFLKKKSYIKILGTSISETGRGGQEWGSAFFCSKMILKYFHLKVMSGWQRSQQLIFMLIQELSIPRKRKKILCHVFYILVSWLFRHSASINKQFIHEISSVTAKLMDPWEISFTEKEKKKLISMLIHGLKESRKIVQEHKCLLRPLFLQSYGWKQHCIFGNSAASLRTVH